MIESAACFPEDTDQPEHRHPPQAEVHPVAMNGKVLIQQQLQAQPRELRQQQLDINAFTGGGQGLAHTETLSQFLKPLKI